MKFYIHIVFTDNIFNLHSPFKIKTYCEGPKTIPWSFVLFLELGFSLLLIINYMIGIENMSLPLVIQMYSWSKGCLLISIAIQSEFCWLLPTDSGENKNVTVKIEHLISEKQKVRRNRNVWKQRKQPFYIDEYFDRMFSRYP